MATAQSISFGALLKRYRRAAGLTQEALAERAGYSGVYIGMLERGERVPQRTTVEALSQALSLQPEERARLLASRDGRDRSPPSPTERVPVGPRLVGPRLVGRARESARLKAHLRGEGPLLVLFSGEPGIGKTRLLREAVAWASAEGLSVLEGGCHRRGGQEPYAPLLEALEQHVRAQPPAALHEMLDGCDWLARLLPELADQAAVSVPPSTLAPEQERRLLFRAVGRYLSRAAGPGAAGTLLVLDDLQWAGADALDLLADLVRAGSTATPWLRVMAAFRDTEVRPEEPLGVLLDELGRAGLLTQIELGPLASEEARLLLGELLESGPAVEGGWAISGEHDALADRALQLAGGVPLFLVSIAQALRTSVAAPEQARALMGRVPRDVAQSIRQRMAVLPAAARELLGIAAVVGRQIPRTVLLGVARHAGQAEADVIAALEAACRARLLLEDGEAAYVFAHDLIRDAIAADLSTARRAALHRQIAVAIEQEPGEPPVEQLAHHYLRAGEPAKAVVYLERAGARAESAHAHTAAGEHYRELAARLDDLGRATEAARARERLAEMLKLAARYDEALAAYDRAVEAYRAVGDRAGLARATAQLARIHVNRGTTEEGLARLRALIDTLDVSGLSSGALAEVYVALGVLYDNLGQYAEALAAAERAGVLAEAAGEIRLLGQATRLRGAVFNMLGRPDEGIPVLERAVVLLDAAGDLRDVCFTLNHAAWIYDITGQLDLAWQRFDQAVGVAERLSDPATLASMLCNRGDIEFSRGEWDRARGDFDRALALVDPADTSWIAPFPRIALGMLLLARGEWETAGQRIHEAIALATRATNIEVLRWAHGALAERELLEGDWESARDRLEGLLDRNDQDELDVTRLLPLLAWAYLEGGDGARAEALLERAMARATPMRMRPALALTLRVRALVALRRERWQEAELALAEALALCRAMPAPWAEAKTLYVWGLVHLGAGTPQLAHERFHEAQAICSRLGERLYGEPIAATMAALSVR